MDELTITIERNSDRNLEFNIYNSVNDNEMEPVDGGICTGNIKDAVKMACNQAIFNVNREKDPKKKMLGGASADPIEWIETDKENIPTAAESRLNRINHEKLNSQDECPHEDDITYGRLIQLDGKPQYEVKCETCGKLGIIYLEEGEEDWKTRNKNENQKEKITTNNLCPECGSKETSKNSSGELQCNNCGFDEAND